MVLHAFGAKSEDKPKKCHATKFSENWANCNIFSFAILMFSCCWTKKTEQQTVDPILAEWIFSSSEKWIGMKRSYIFDDTTAFR